MRSEKAEREDMRRHMALHREVVLSSRAEYYAAGRKPKCRR